MYNMIKIWKSGDLEVCFFKEEKTDIVSMAVLPAGASGKIVPHREGIRDTVAAKSICDTLDFAFPASTHLCRENSAMMRIGCLRGTVLMRKILKR